MGYSDAKVGAEPRVASHWMASAPRRILTPLNQVSNERWGWGVCGDFSRKIGPKCSCSVRVKI